MLDWNNLSSWSVLLVEDDPDNAEVIELALTFWGMSVRKAQDGIEGLKILEEFLPDLILLDLSMAKMDGWEMRARVKKDPRTQHIPIVALTAHAMAGDKERALEVGFNGYLSKPISVPTFIQDLRETIESSNSAIEQPIPQYANTDKDRSSSDPTFSKLSEIVNSKETRL
jgi:two-component system cell cycle response regulator DivK